MDVTKTEEENKTFTFGKDGKLLQCEPADEKLHAFLMSARFPQDLYARGERTTTQKIIELRHIPMIVPMLEYIHNGNTVNAWSSSPQHLPTSALKKHMRDRYQARIAFEDKDLKYLMQWGDPPVDVILPLADTQTGKVKLYYRENLFYTAICETIPTMPVPPRQIATREGGEVIRYSFPPDGTPFYRNDDLNTLHIIYGSSLCLEERQEIWHMCCYGTGVKSVKPNVEYLSERDLQGGD